VGPIIYNKFFPTSKAKFKDIFGFYPSGQMKANNRRKNQRSYLLFFIAPNRKLNVTADGWLFIA